MGDLHPNDSNPESTEDAALAKTLSALDRDAPSMSDETLDQVAEKGLAMMADASTVLAKDSMWTSKTDSCRQQTNARAFWGRRVVVAGLTFLVLYGAYYLDKTGQQASASPIKFSEVMKTTFSDQLMEFQLNRDGKSASVLIASDGRVRHAETPTRYQIARGNTLWRIDEKRKLVESGTNPWLSDSQVNLVALLGYSAEPKRYRALTASETVEHNGEECHVFRLATLSDPADIVVEALAAVDSKKIVSLAAWPREAIRRGAPIAELRLVARRNVVDEAKFVVGSWYSKDGRVGTVTDFQGLVSIRPLGQERWTPIIGRTILEPQDWVRIDPRGANAATVELPKTGNLTLGPGTIVEIVSPTKVNVIRGELKASVAKGKSLAVTHGELSRKLEGVVHLRFRKGELQELKHVPSWLSGFLGTKNEESIGSLIAKVNERDVPLTVGYHKVTVEVRDQIARTTIEESFVNQTGSQLEGVFYFPLPQDASIAGFGMWINNELVEADVVEKQRAREIYETIKRERRDPGLLEWSGGNVFKASVFPILPHSAKRIKITYTQVLPLNGRRYKYRYGLRSEMLKQNPLSELSINFKVYSSIPINKIDCPTHDARVNLTEHAAQVEFTEQQYTPDSDFEVAVDISADQANVVAIPHRRGEDGYFMLQLTPPSGASNWRPDVVRDGKPLDLLVVADTSGSMDRPLRKKQAEFIAALLTSLGPKDRFNVGVADVDCRWVFDKRVVPSADSINKVRDLLASRASLGWSDLPQAFRSIAARVKPGTQVLYIGDGTVTVGSLDPAEFVNQLKTISKMRKGTFHSVSVGSTFEPLVMKAIAGVGGGSWRELDSHQSSAQVARSFLMEVASPGIKDLKVEIKGIPVAKVYPERLPNLAPGTQHILLGRYLPSAKEDRGEVVVTGKVGDEAVRYKARLDLDSAESGNSFIPRLWARMHLDTLLAEGRSSEAVQDIIALSERFHIMTPYTSLLVLETDADRERFKVKRRVQMRDGEKFFSEGRSKANYVLRQKQMRTAGQWRLALRQAILRSYSRLGRTVPQPRYRGYAGAFFGRTAPSNTWSDSLRYEGRDLAKFAEESEAFRGEDDEESASEFAFKELGDVLAEDGLSRLHDELDGAEVDLYESAYKMDQGIQFGNKSLDYYRSNFDSNSLYGKAAGDRGRRAYASGEMNWDANFSLGQAMKRIRTAGWVRQLFPASPVAAPIVTPKHEWPKEAVAFADLFNRYEQLSKLQGGLEIQLSTEIHNVRWNRVTSQINSRSLFSPEKRYQRSGGPPNDTYLYYCDKSECRIYSRGLQLGRTRKVMDVDLQQPMRDIPPFYQGPIYRSYSSYTPKLGSVREGKRTLTLTYDRTKQKVEFTFDVENKLLLEIASFSSGKLTSRIVHSDFVQAGEMKWPKKVEHFTGDAKKPYRVENREYRKLTAKQFEDEVDKAKQAWKAGLFLQPMPGLAEARESTSLQRGTLEDHLVMMDHFASSQQWERVKTHFDAATKLANGKDGLKWVEFLRMQSTREREQLRIRLGEEAEKLLQGERREDELFISLRLYSILRTFAAASERRVVLDRIKPIFERAPAVILAEKTWSDFHLSLLRNMNKPKEIVAERRRQAQAYPFFVSSHRNLATDLINYEGEFDKAMEVLDAAIGLGQKWSRNEQDQLRKHYADLLQRYGYYARLLRFTKAWSDDKDAYQSAHDRYLAALVWNDKISEMESIVAQWLDAAAQALHKKKLLEVASIQPLKQTEVPEQVTIKSSAAVSVIMGQGYIRRRTLDRKWHPTLDAAVRAFLRHESLSSLARRVTSDRNYRRTEGFIKVHLEIFELVKQELATLPVRDLQSLLPMAQGAAIKVPENSWKEMAQALEVRWDKGGDEQHQVGQLLIGLLGSKVSREERLRFIRKQLANGPEKLKTQYANALFSELQSHTWSDAHEEELFSLLPKLDFNEKAMQRIASLTTHLLRLNDWSIRSHAKVLETKITEDVKANRIKFRDAKRKIARDVRAALAKRLVEEAAKAKDALGDWMRVEATYWNVKGENALVEVADACEKYLGEKPPALEIGERAEDEEVIRLQMSASLRHRYLTTACYLSSLRATNAKIAPFTLKYMKAGLAQSAARPDASEREKNAHKAALKAWRTQYFNFSIALNQVQSLERDLTAWIPTDDRTAPWRSHLANLLAEQGRLQEATKLFAGVEKDDELTANQYAQLADWHMALGDEAAYRTATLSKYRVMHDRQLRLLVQKAAQLHNRTDGSAPANLDEDIFIVLEQGLRKSTSPQSYQGPMSSLYLATKDFRVLQAMPHGVIGHTSQAIYGYLYSASSLLSQVHEEATIDSVMETLAKVKETTDTPIDLRALDLILVAAERRAAEVQDQPGEHIARALQALKRAFEQEWRPGERRMMADYLVNLGRITDKGLHDEQLRQIKELYRSSESGTVNHLHIGSQVSNLMWQYGQKDEALAIFEDAIKQFYSIHGDKWPRSGNSYLTQYINRLINANWFQQAERRLVEFIARPENAAQELFLNNELNRVYLDALSHRRLVSLGRGAQLYRALQHRFKTNLAQTSEANRQGAVNWLCSLYTRGTSTLGVPTTRTDIRRFAFEEIPVLLKRTLSNHRQIISAVGNCCRSTLGYETGIEFIVVRIEEEPVRFRYQNDYAWRHFGGTLANWMYHCSFSIDRKLEKRLLAIVLAELRRDLLTGNGRYRYLYGRRSSYQWSRKVGEFVKVAEAVLKERPDSVQTAVHTAAYLFGEVKQYDRAIEVLFDFHRKDRLTDSQIATLVGYLHDQERYGESIALLERLMKKYEGSLSYRIQLMTAYYQTNRSKQLSELLAATDEYFHEGTRWTESVMSQLAHACKAVKLWKESAAYFDEAIDVHQKARANRGIGSHTLSSYYYNLAEVLSNLGDTKGAVDAASGAIIVWTRDLRQRKSAMTNLVNVLARAKDRDSYAKWLDEQAEKNQEERPIVRKALGQAYLQSGRHKDAAAQLKLAVENAPNDDETHQLLITCYDALELSDEAIRQTLELLQLDRRNLQVIANLSTRLEGAEQERATTTLVEMKPNESESHSKIASIREEQNRWADAIHHWKHVARLRSLEPTGLLQLAKAQIHQKQWIDARATLSQLDEKSWPARFNNVRKQTRDLWSKVKGTSL